jgi:hypothetical protein
VSSCVGVSVLDRGSERNSILGLIHSTQKARR